MRETDIICPTKMDCIGRCVYTATSIDIDGRGWPACFVPPVDAQGIVPLYHALFAYTRSWSAFMNVDHKLRTAKFLWALAIAIGAFVGCETGPGAPAPAWAPPSWMHGTWSALLDAGGSFTLKAASRNVEVAMRSGGVVLTVDLAEIADEGTATIEHRTAIAGRDRHFPGQTGRRYYWVHADGAGIAFSFFDVNRTTIAAFAWTAAGGWVGPFTLTKDG